MFKWGFDRSKVSLAIIYVVSILLSGCKFSNFL
jgi:hypothetical protein